MRVTRLARSVLYIAWALVYLSAEGLAQDRSVPEEPVEEPVEEPAKEPAEEPPGATPDDAVDDASVPADDTISDEAVREAKRLFDEANELMDQLRYAEAAEKYQAALEWIDDPSFHFNLSVAQRNLGQPLEAYHSIDAVLAFGVDILGEEQHAQALDIRAELETLLGRVIIVCAQPDAHVSLDGERQSSDTGDGRYELLVEAGLHQLVVSREGLQTETRQVRVAQGERVEETVILKPPPRFRSVHPVAQWKPWSVVVAGAALSAVGAGFHWRSYQNFNDFDRDFYQLCEIRGCVRDDSTQTLFGQYDRAGTQRVVALASYGVGGALVAAGLVWVVFNEPKTVRVDDGEATDESPVVVHPILAPDRAGVSLRIRY